MTDDDDDATLQFLQQQLQPASPPNPALKSPYPVGFALDLALETAPLADILASYELTPSEAQAIFANDVFRREFRAHRQAMSVDGYSFKMKCKAQSEGYLKLLWNLAHAADTPAPVRAQIVANTVKWAALDSPPGIRPPSEDGGGHPSQELLEALRELPADELEVRVLSIMIKNKGSAAVRSLLIDQDSSTQ